MSDTTISRYGRAECPECGDEYSLLKDGTIRSHRDKRVADVWSRPQCRGSKREPKA